MKTLFADVPFKTEMKLGAVNSVNCVRVMAQIVYYFYAGLQVRKECGSEKIQFSVPTGNFGNVLAGWMACRMGLPVEQFVVATNRNDILHRFFTSGTYEPGRVSPSFAKTGLPLIVIVGLVIASVLDRRR